jgi:hypothetical protein
MGQDARQYSGILRMPTEPNDPGLPVTIDVDDVEMAISAEVGELGRWPKETVAVVAREDAFHVLAEGEQILLDVERDAEFAVDMGLTTAPPELRRRMSMVLRNR